MILRIEIPKELIRQDAEIVIKVSNRNNALGYVIERMVANMMRSK